MNKYHVVISRKVNVGEEVAVEQVTSLFVDSDGEPIVEVNAVLVRPKPESVPVVEAPSLDVGATLTSTPPATVGPPIDWDDQKTGE